MWVLALSIPFYGQGALWPVRGLPFDLPATVVMIFVPAAVVTALVRREGGAPAPLALWRLCLIERASFSEISAFKRSSTQRSNFSTSIIAARAPNAPTLASRRPLRASRCAADLPERISPAL
jgi:hypothetical protein